MFSHVDGAATELPTSVFLLGDLLGAIIIAPPLLCLAERTREADKAFAPARPRWRDLQPAAILFALGWAIAILLPDLRMMPVMLMMTWLGLRHGSRGAWIAIILSGTGTLLWSASVADIPTKLTLHVGLAIAAVSAYLAGSYTDAQRSARATIARRDRLLFQAERLKTLRAMSVAVIHEISQPLSTLAIESRHLAAISPAGSEAAQSAALIARKVDTLSTMIRRMRRFGGRAVDEPSPLSLALLLGDVVKLALGEAGCKAGRIKLTHQDTDIFVMGQEVELTQALLNLVRNAVTASPAGPVTIALGNTDAIAAIVIANRPESTVADTGGFGVGSLIARAIIGAHSGTLTRTSGEDGMILHEIHLPTSGTDHV